MVPFGRFKIFTIKWQLKEQSNRTGKQKSSSAREKRLRILQQSIRTKLQYSLLKAKDFEKQNEGANRKGGQQRREMAKLQ